MKELIQCALGRAPCDVLITGAEVFNVFTGEFERADVAVCKGKIVGVGKGFSAKRIYDGTGRYLLPAFCDAHVHVESSMLSPQEFARVASIHGTTAIVADPHEIVNVCGIEGAEYVKESFARIEKQPVDVYLQLPSCVPATPFETSGAKIDGNETERELARATFFGLGEMMNYPAVLSCEEDVLQKLQAAQAQNKPVDGHAPAILGNELNAYRCGGILTDHECLTAEECREKVARGMYVQLRHGSSTSGLKTCATAIDGFNFRRFLLCSDDKNAGDLLSKGHIDDGLRTLVSCGVAPEYAILFATHNVAECYGLRGKGAIAPSYDADMVLVDDVQNFSVHATFKRGELVAEEGKALFQTQEYLPTAIKDTVRVKPVQAEDFRIRLSTHRAKAIAVLPRSLVTNSVTVEVKSVDGDLDLTGSDLCKLAVIERHFASGNMGLALVKGYGLTGGAIGISVSHDSHNLVILGDNNRDMARVCNLLREAGGGMVLVKGEREEVFPLDIAGLMSSLSCEEVARRTAQLSQTAREMGVKDGYEPFMTLAFLALPVIPKLKLTDKGLFDVEKFAFTSLEEIE